MATAIQNPAGIKLVTIDKAAHKYALTLYLNWAGLFGTNQSDLALPVVNTARVAFEDVFKLISVNQAASQNVPRIQYVAGMVSFFPQSVANTAIPPGGLYLISDTGQIIGIEEKLNTFNTPTQPFGEVNPGSVSFALPFDTQSINSNIKIVKYADDTVASNACTGSCTLTFYTYKLDPFIR